MKKHFLIILLSFLSVSILAQPKVHLGLTTAFNSTFVLDKGLSQDPRYASEMTFEWAPVGFTFGVDFTKKFGLSLEAIKAAQGQIFQVIDAADQIVGARKIEMNYLQLPLLFKFMSGGNGGARFNFNIGPQINFLQSGVETLEYLASTQNIPAGLPIPDGATQNPDGTYNVPEQPLTTLLSSAADNEIQKFKNKELQLAIAFGLDIDISKNLYLNTNIRGNYSITDTRNSDLIAALENGGIGDLFSRRANLTVGVQLGLHWMIGGTRSFKAREKEVLKQLGN
jgi:outer membrane protein with beta-barrel domain